MILDTSFIIDLLQNNVSAISKAQELDKSNMPILLTTITIFELWQGTDLKDKKKEERVKNILERFALVFLDFEGARLAGIIYKDLSTKGQIIEPEDCMIAGITLSRNEILITRNKKHFSRIPELKIENY